MDYSKINCHIKKHKKLKLQIAFSKKENAIFFDLILKYRSQLKIGLRDK